MSISLGEFRKALKHADNLIAGTKTGRGRPNDQEASMFVASVALTYAAWEAYVEDVAIEAAGHLTIEVEPKDVPASALKAIEATKPSPWQLTIHPGWQSIWRDAVRDRAKGDPTKAVFGMNTARVHQIKMLFEVVGLDAIGAFTATDKKSLEELVTARGSVVHSANAPDSFKKGKAKDYRNLVERMAVALDEHLKEQMVALTAKEPWE